jgi:hypothetical protein
MEALRNRIHNLIFKFDFSETKQYEKQTFTLDYQSGQYRQDELVKIIDHAIPYFALTESEFEEYRQSGDFGEARETGYSRISTAHRNKKGDYGELLLFLILDVIHNVPKFVTKVRLRSTMSEQIKGYDCAHVTIENDEPCLWLGEAKFHQTFSTAVSEAFKSLDEHMETSYLEDELKILGGNIEWNKSHPNYDTLKKVFQGRSIDRIKFKIPILLTYDSNSVKNNADLNDQFKTNLINEVTAHYATIEKKTLKEKKANFEFLFIIFPLHTVQNIKQRLEQIETLAR